MRLREVPKSAWLSWGVSYVLVLLIPLSVFTYGSFLTSRMMRAEIANANALILESVHEAMDAKLVEMKNAFRFTVSNTVFAELRYQPEIGHGFRYRSAELIEILLTYLQSIDEEIGVTIYFDEKGYLMSETTANADEILYAVQRSTGLAVSIEDWKSSLSADYANEFFFARGLRIGSAEPCIVYCHTVRGIEEDINILVTLPEASIAAHFDRLEGRSLVLADAGGTIISAFGDHYPVPRLDLSLPSGSTVVGADDRAYVYTYKESSESSWFYGVVTPKGRYWNSLRRLAYLATAATATGLFLGVLVSYILLKRNYRPLNSIMELLRGHGPRTNEFDVIRSSYTKLIGENSDMRDTLNLQTKQLRERYLLARLKGRHTTLSEEDANAHFEIETNGREFCLVVFAVAMPNNAALKQYHDDLEYENVNLFILDKIFAGVFRDHCYYKVEDGHVLMYVLNFGPRNSTWWQSNRNAVLQHVRKVFVEQRSVDLFIVVSPSVREFSRIRSLYRDAMDTLEYQSIIGDDGILFTEDLKGGIGLSDPQRNDWVQDLTRAVSRADLGRCEQILDGLFGEYSDSTTMTFAVFRFGVISCLYTALDAYFEVVTDNELRDKLMSKISHVFTTDCVEELRVSLLSILKYTCKSIEAERVGSNNVLIHSVRDYILRHHTDCNLNISSISDAIGRNPRYLSHVFYEQTGEGLLDHIREIRVAHAKELLGDSALTIEDISRRVGFANVRTFRRAFVRVAGVSPSQYTHRQ